MNNEKNNSAVDQQVLVDVLAKALVEATKAKQPEKAPEPDDGGLNIDLMELMYHVLSKVHYILVCALIGAIVMVAQAANSIPMYSATSKMYIVGNQGAVINVSDLQLGSMLTMDYEEVFRTWEVHEMVRSQLGVDYTYSQLQSMISISNPTDTRILYITARHADAQMAADIANAYASAAKEFILYTMESEEPNLFSVALVPSVASRVSKSKNAVLGFMVGAVLAAVLIVLLFIIDDRPRTPEHIMQAADLPTLATIPAVNKKSIRAKKRRGSRAVS